MPTLTRENIDEYIDKRQVYIQSYKGKWYEIRRNGKTQRWADPNRIRIPFKHQLRLYGAITESDFMDNGVLNENDYRHFDDVPEDRRV